jgi:hypothetical protein
MTAYMARARAHTHTHTHTHTHSLSLSLTHSHIHTPHQTQALQRLIRKKDRSIFATFEASFEGEWVDFDVETNFDPNFFLAGAEDIIEEYAEEKAAADKE